MAKSIAHRTDTIISQCLANCIPIERLSAKSLQEKWPNIQAPNLLGGVEGLYENRMAGYVNPRSLVSAQLSITKKAGGVLLRGEATEVTKNKSSNHWEVRIKQEGNISEICSKNILIATGAFTNFIGVLPQDFKIALNAFTEPNLLFELNQQNLDRYLHMPTIITVDPEDTGDHNKSIYLLPPIKYPDGKWYMRIGPGMQPIVKQLETLEEMRQWFIQQRITTRQHNFLKRIQKMLIPDIEPVSVREACCIIEKTPSHYPYIGKINDDSSCSVVVGGNGHGARGSDEIGRLAANLVLGNEWDFPISQSMFTPILATDRDNIVQQKFKPPFGLC